MISDEKESPVFGYYLFTAYVQIHTHYVKIKVDGLKSKPSVNAVKTAPLGASFGKQRTRAYNNNMKNYAYKEEQRIYQDRTPQILGGFK